MLPRPRPRRVGIRISSIPTTSYSHHYQHHEQYQVLEGLVALSSLSTSVFSLAVALSSSSGLVVCTVVLPLLVSRPSPPAPEGWERDTPTTRGLHTVHINQILPGMVMLTSYSCCAYELLDVLLLFLVLLMAGWFGCPSPPAPEGWDKDITQLHTSRITSSLTTTLLLNYFGVLYSRCFSPIRLCYHDVLSVVPLCMYVGSVLGSWSSPPAPEG